MRPDLDGLCRKLGYTFSERNLLEAALTHRSAGGNNNERLEFLGDAVLNFIVAEQLYARFPDADEGRLSRLRAKLVSGDSLAQQARVLALGEHVRLGPGELKSGGFRRKSILADAFEALIGAVYLDAGMSPCQKVVATLFAEQLSSLAPELELKDAKTRLQEYLQARRLGLPEYEVVSVAGEAHARVFAVECNVPELETRTRGSGSTRRRAEQEAAARALELLEEP